MDYPQRNTDAAKKYGLERENADSGRGRPLPLRGEQAKKGNSSLSTDESTACCRSWMG